MLLRTELSSELFKTKTTQLFERSRIFSRQMTRQTFAGNLISRPFPGCFLCLDLFNCCKLTLKCRYNFCCQLCFAFVLQYLIPIYSKTCDCVRARSANLSEKKLKEINSNYTSKFVRQIRQSFEFPLRRLMTSWRFSFTSDDIHLLQKSNLFSKSEKMLYFFKKPFTDYYNLLLRRN